MRNIKYLFTVIALLLSSLTMSAFDFKQGIFYFNITSETDLTVEVTYNAYDNEYVEKSTITIPAAASYAGKTYRVTSIGASTFSDCTFLTLINIPEGITSIGSSAFSGCSMLTFIVFPVSLTEIGRNAFKDCHRLTSIPIPEYSNLTSIGSGAFSGCFGLTSITIPEHSKLTSIGSNAFDGCTGLTSINVSECSNLTSIGDYAFSGCSSLTSINIPESVTEIGYRAFSGCISLTSITIPGDITSIGNYAFEKCSSLIRVTILEGVNSIGNNTFNGCSSLASITIPRSVTSIGDYAFYNCCSLTSITIPDGVTSIGKDAFYGCSNITSVHINSIEAWCKISFGNSSSNPLSYVHSLYLNGGLVTILDIPGSVTSIGSYAFYNCSSLIAVAFPEYSKLTSIGGFAFSNCTNLTSITIPEGVTKIGRSAFSGCSSLASITLPKNSQLTSIGESGFEDCSNLTSITIPEGVTSIGDAAFTRCTRLSSITIPEKSKLTSIGEWAFFGCSNFTSITIPEGVTKIGRSAFSGCSSLASITLPKNSQLTSIGESGFEDCSNLTSITISEGVTSIGLSAFEGCSSLTAITFPEYSKLTSIGERAFFGCSSLTFITIPEDVASIGNAAFTDCISLKEVIIEDGKQTLTLGYNKYDYTLGEGLFYDCPLESVYLGRNLSHEIGVRYGYSPFYEKGLKSLTIGRKMTSIDNYVFNHCTAKSITCMSQSPPTINSSTFSFMQKYMPVYVHVNSVSAYKSADYWSEFAEIQAMPIAHVTLSESSVTLVEGEVLELAITISPDGADKKLVSWSSNLPNIASVDNTGKVTAIAPGTATITVQTNRDSGVSASCEVTVEPFMGITSLDQLNNETLYYISLPKHSEGVTSWAVAEGEGILKSSAQLGITPDSNDPRQHFAIISYDDGTRYLYHAAEKKFVCKEGTLKETPIDDIYFKSGAYANTFVVYFDDQHYVNVGVGGILNLNYYKTADGGNSSQIFPMGVFDSMEIPQKTEIEGIVYFLMPETKQAEVCRYNNTGDVIIPSMVSYDAKEYSVTSIGDYAFKGCSSLTSITMPESVTSIGDYAFKGCSSLTSITIPESVTSIGDYAFQGCSSLTSITIPESVAEIGDYAFWGCTGELQVNCNMSFASSLNGVFYGSKFNKVVIGDEVTSIGDYAFQGCSSLTSITIPESVTEIGECAFSRCSSLTSITIPENSQLTTIGGSAFEGCSSLTSITIPENSQLTTIGGSAFEGCSSLTSITIPENSQLTTIGERAFFDCGSLTSITIPEGVTSIGERVFANCSSLIAITFPEYSNLTSIGGFAFSNCTNLTDITIPESVTLIGDYAFDDCSSLATITIPENSKLISIGNNAFHGCSSLATITIPVGVTSIGNYAFYNCCSLTSITIPEGVTSIGRSAFSGCSSLTSITIPENSQLTTIGGSAFEGCSSLASITLPESVKSIGDFAFYGCSSLTSVTCKAISPPTITNSTFVNKKVLVYVPTASVEDYKSADYWEKFDNIQPIIISVTLNDTVANLFEGEVLELDVVTIPEDVDKELLVWTSSDPSVADVAGGVVTAKATGAAIITATANGDSGMSTSCKVIVVPFKGITSLEQLNNETLYYISQPKHSKGLTSWIVDQGGSELKSSAQLGIEPDEKDTRQHFVVISDDGGVTRYLYHTAEKKFVCEDGSLCNSPIDAIHFKSGAYTNTFVAYFDDQHYVNVGGGRSMEINNWNTADGGNSCVILPVGEYDPAEVLKAFNGISGVCGDNLTWTLCEGVLTISGTGEMSDLMSSTQWAEYREDILEIEVEEGVTSIGDYAFMDCNSLTSITVSESVNKIGNGAFDGCTSLKEITFEDGSSILALGYNSENVYGTGEGLFCDCPLEKVYLGRNLSYDSTRKYGLTPFCNKTKMASVTISESVTEIKENSFYNCKGLTSITIPTSVTLIGSSAFYGCSNLTAVHISSLESWCEISFGGNGSNPFSYASELYLNGELIAELVIPEGVTSIGDYAFSYCTNLTAITIPESVTSIGRSAFSGCSGLASITISEGVTSIGYAAFDGCSSLTSITIPESVTSIGNFAFYRCSNLISFTIPEGVTSIGEGAFRNCSSLTSITIPEGVTSIGELAFYECASLTAVHINNLEAWCNISFGDFGSNPLCSAQKLYLNGELVTKLVIPEGVTSVGNYAFYGCSSLTSVAIPESVTKIGSSAFGGCSSLCSIVCKAISPPTITNSTFVNKKVLVYVPTASVEDYKKADYWGAFINIQTVLSLSQSEATLTEGESLTLIATLLPDDATGETVTWSSSDPKVVTVEDGVVTALAAGTATITVLADNNKAYCVVTVIEASDVDDVLVDGENVIYDLNGRRVDEPTKGVYIVNGHKVVIK